MAFKYADRVKETTTTTGTGTITLLGAAADFRAFTSALSVGDTTAYCIQDLTNHTWEIGVGTLATANTLTRDTVLGSSTGSVISFAAGTKDVFITLPADHINAIADNTAAVGTAGTYTSVTTDAYGRVTSGTNPTTLTGYGITDAPTLTGTGASGTWGINISGNAISATTAASLTTARTINGVSFDGSANIVINAVDSTAREASITAGTTEQYWRGDKSWQSFPTSLPASDVSAWAKAGTKPTYTASEVGLGNVNNTDDTAKPVSTAQQTALNLKANLADPTFTGTVGGITAAMVGAPFGSGSSTGTNTGDQTTISGNAGSATVLQTARTINGVSFNGSANITINAVDSTARVASSLLGAVSGVATLDETGKVPSTQLPSYVDDVIEGANLAAFPGTGEAGKIYVALDTNKTYRWSGSAYIYITSGAVDSVAGKTGVVTLVRGDVGLGNVDNTSDANKSVSYASTAGSAPASDVYSWAKATAKPTYTAAEVGSDAAGTARPASDVYSWAKAASKPSYAASEVGLGNVNNTADSTKSVSYASTAGSLAVQGNTHTVYGPNSTWAGYLMVGGDGSGSLGNASTATVATSNGNLHLDAGNDKATYLNFYHGTMGVNFGNGASGIVGAMSASGQFWCANYSGSHSGSSSGTNTGDQVIPTSLPANGGTATNLTGGFINAYGNSSVDFTHGENFRVGISAARNGGGQGDAYLYFWTSEPGQTWTGGGIGRNMSNTATNARLNTVLSGQMMRFTEAGTITFVTETSGGTRHQPLTLNNDGSANFESTIVAGGNVTAYSDERLKKDWTPLQTDFVYRLAQVKSGTYTRIDGLKLRQVGVGAQSLQGLMPEAILSGTDGMLSVAYGNAALAACVELAKEVVELKKRLAALE